VLPGLLLVVNSCSSGAIGARLASWWWICLPRLLLALLLLLRRQVLGAELAGASRGGAGRLGMSGRALTMLRVSAVGRCSMPAHCIGLLAAELVASTASAGEASGSFLVAGSPRLVQRQRAPWCRLARVVRGALLPVSNVLVPSGIVLAERTLFLRASAPWWRSRACRALWLASRVRPGLPGLGFACAAWSRSDNGRPNGRGCGETNHISHRSVQDAPRSSARSVPTVTCSSPSQAGSRGGSVCARHHAVATRPGVALANNLAVVSRDGRRAQE